MLPISSEPNSPASTPTWSDVARLCRRICLLREQARGEEAEALHRSALIPLAASLQGPTESEAELSARLEATLVAETERVATATVLAELIVPMLRADRSAASISPTALPLPATLASGRAEIRPLRSTLHPASGGDDRRFSRRDDRPGKRCAGRRRRDAPTLLLIFLQPQLPSKGPTTPIL